MRGCEACGVPGSAGPCIVVFRVSGTITLKTAIRVSTPSLTVAGQTSPGGVQIRGTGSPRVIGASGSSTVRHDIVVRHLRVRMEQSEARCWQ